MKNMYLRSATMLCPPDWIQLEGTTVTEAATSTARQPSQVMEYLVKEIMPGKWYAIPNAATNIRNTSRNEKYRDPAKDLDAHLENTLELIPDWMEEMANGGPPWDYGE